MDKKKQKNKINKLEEREKKDKQAHSNRGPVFHLGSAR